MQILEKTGILNTKMFSISKKDLFYSKIYCIFVENNQYGQSKKKYDSCEYK